jgi:hypothetical protein
MELMFNGILAHSFHLRDPTGTEIEIQVADERTRLGFHLTCSPLHQRVIAPMDAGLESRRGGGALCHTHFKVEAN